jgi:hypothetical protein
MPINTNFTGNLTSRYAARLIGGVAREAYTKLADDVLLPSLRKDLPGHFSKKVNKRITGRGLDTQMVIFSNEPGIKEIEEGRKPGGNVNINAIIRFVRKKGLGGNALSVKTRRALTIGIPRSRERATGKLRTRAKSLAAKQKSIAFAIATMIKREGLPRNTGFPPSHNLRLFENLKAKHAAEVNAAITSMQDRIAQILNANG